MVTIKDIGPNYNIEELKHFIDRFTETSILVIGDLILDKYIWGDVSRISPEAPVPVVEVTQETEMLGGAANVIHNIISLGGHAIPCGVVGDDQTGRKIIDKLEAMGSNADGVFLEPGRPTSVKTRIIAHQQQVVRFDRESLKEIRRETIGNFLSFIGQQLDKIDAIIVADYGKGVISAEMMKGLGDLVRDSSVLVAVDPKTDNFKYYQGIDVITPNHHEAGSFCRINIDNETSLIQAGRKMLEELNCRSVLITQGKDGMSLFEEGGEISHIPTVARKVFDVTGAGDTVIGALSLGLASGMDLKSAAIISNYAAGIVVGELGTTTVRAEDLKRALYRKLDPAGSEETSPR